MAKFNTDHKIEYAYANVPLVYAKKIIASKQGVFDEAREDCISALQLSGLEYPFVEMPFDLNEYEDVIAYLCKHNIPCFLQQVYTEELYTDQILLLNADCIDFARMASSTEYKLYPVRGELQERAKVAKERIRQLKPDAAFINSVMRQQEVLLKLTGSLDVLTEFVYDPKK